MPDNFPTTKTASWYGRLSADPGTIFCSRNGWREATWERDGDGQWSEIEATIRPVVFLAADGSGRYGLGDARKVK